MQKFWIAIGILFILLGLFWPVLAKIPWGRLPGDVVISRPHLKIYFPLTTMLLVSLLLSLLFWMWKR